MTSCSRWIQKVIQLRWKTTFFLPFIQWRIPTFISIYVMNSWSIFSSLKGFSLKHDFHSINHSVPAQYRTLINIECHYYYLGGIYGAAYWSSPIITRQQLGKVASFKVCRVSKNISKWSKRCVNNLTICMFFYVSFLRGTLNGSYNLGKTFRIWWGHIRWAMKKHGNCPKLYSSPQT